MTGPGRLRTGLTSVVVATSLSVYLWIPIVAPNSDMTGELIFGAATASFVLVGLLLVMRAPGNRIGPVLLATGALLAFGYGCDVYGSAGAQANPVWPGSVMASVLGGAFFVVPIALALPQLVPRS